MRSQPSLAAATRYAGRSTAKNAWPASSYLWNSCGLPCCGEDLVELGDLLGAGVLVLLAEQPEQRAAQIGQPVDEVGDREREVPPAASPVTNAP